MTRDEIISTIQNSADAIKAEGATALYIFGSRARGDEHSGSDLDIFIDYEPDTHFSLMELAGIKILIEDALDLDVHITTQNSLHPEMREDIEKDAIRVL